MSLDTQHFRISGNWLRWIIFLTLLASVAISAIRGVLVRAKQMSTADTSASTFASISPGSPAKVVVRLESVKGKDLKGLLLEKQSDTVYLVPSDRKPTVTAVLSDDTSVVMGKPDEVTTAAIVQLGGIVDADHVLQTNQVVILTGYVHLLTKQGDSL